MTLPSLLKNKTLVEQRRKQIIPDAVNPFIENGLHKTTAREIAKTTGIFSGSLYEKIDSKEDILYLVCNPINEEIKKKIKATTRTRIQKGKNALPKVIKEHFLIYHQRQDQTLLIYQETSSLPKKGYKKVLTKGRKVTAFFKDIIIDLRMYNNMPPIKSKQLDILAKNITVLGYM